MQKTPKISVSSLVTTILCCLVSCLSAQTPALLKDINQTQVNSNPRNMTLSGSTVFFSVDDNVHGRELWKTNGTSASTVLVKDIDPSGSSNPANFCNVNGIVFFTATRPSEGAELWKTDGTAAGTVLVADVLSGSAGSQISQLTACNGKVYFSALKRTVNQTGVIDELKLFVSDGTPAGTIMLDANSGLSVPLNLTAVGTTLFFSANSNAVGSELWKTTGTPASVQMVKDIRTTPVGAGSAPRNFINVAGTLFFSANDGTNGRQLWKSNGTTVTTLRVSSIQTQGVAGTELAEIANVSGVVFFSASSGLPNQGNQIFKVNSASTNTTLISVQTARSLTSAGGKLFFTQTPQIGNPTLCFINANSTTVNPLKDFPATIGNESGIPLHLIAASGNLFFTAGTVETGRELWKSNATIDGTKMVQDFVGGIGNAGISDMCVSGNQVYFACNGTNGNELRRSDGTLNGIITIRNITHAGSLPTGFTKFGNFTYFAANDGVNGRELWRTDGTVEGTVLFKDINTNAPSSSPDNFLVVTTSNGTSTLFFVANNGNQGRELYRSNGTAAGTVRISDFTGDLGSGISNMTNVNGVLHFTAPSGLSTGNQIFKVNSTLPNVISTGGSVSNADNLVAIGSTLFFTQSPQAGGPQLCKLVTDATTVIKTFDLIPGGAYPVPQRLTAVGARLFFTAATAANGRELWKTTGTTASTIRISDITLGAGDAGIGNMTSFNGTLHFTASSGTSLGTRIYKTNSTVTGVETTGGSHVQADNLVALGTKLFFTQQSHEAGVGPNLSVLEAGNSTSPKTFEILADDQYSGPLQLTAAGNKIFFTAADATNGRELWKSDGTINGTVLVANMRPGIGNANILSMVLSGTELFLSLNTLEYGQEPYIITNATQILGDVADDRQETAEVTQIEAIPVPEIKVYPNPATDFVRVDLPAAGLTGILSLMTTSGQLVHEVQATSGNTQISMDVQELPRGLYIVRWVQSDEQIVVKKLIVQ